jgi:hypothetical protein
LKISSPFFARLAGTMILLFYNSHGDWDDKHTPSFFPWRWGSHKYFFAPADLAL